MPNEIDTFAFAISGLVAEKDFQTQATPVDFFYAKGIVEAFVNKLELNVEFSPYQGMASMHPGRTASISLDGEIIGFVGQVHPQAAKNYDIPETYVAELSLTAIEAALKSDNIFVEITKFPMVTRDLALLLDKETSHKDIVSAMTSVGIKQLTTIKLFDVYQGANIAVDKKSMAYSLTFQNPNDNLTDEEVARYMEKIIKALIEEIGAEVR